MTTETTIKGYTTYGSVRGGCDHLHRTREAAQVCADRDQRGCARSGYSDRTVAVVGGDGYLYHDEDCQDWVPAEGGRSNGGIRF